MNKELKNLVEKISIKLNEIIIKVKEAKNEY